MFGWISWRARYKSLQAHYLDLYHLHKEQKAELAKARDDIKTQLEIRLLNLDIKQKMADELKLRNDEIFKLRTEIDKLRDEQGIHVSRLHISDDDY